MSSDDLMVRVQVDTETCIGSGQCEMIEEATFLLDDDTGIASVIGTGLLPSDRAEKVVDMCPGRAISIAAETSETPATAETINAEAAKEETE